MRVMVAGYGYVHLRNWDAGLAYAGLRECVCDIAMPRCNLGVESASH